MNEAFDIKKFLKSFFTGNYWIKVVAFGIGFAILISLAFGVYNFFFKKPAPTQSIHAEKGANVTVYQQNERKKTLIPFVEGFGQQVSDEKMQTGIRAGLRFEW